MVNVRIDPLPVPVMDAVEITSATCSSGFRAKGRRDHIDLDSRHQTEQVHPAVDLALVEMGIEHAGGRPRAAALSITAC
jgi:hypothetical protein